MTESPKILHRYNYIFTFLLILFEVTILLAIFLLTVKLKTLLDQKIKGAYVTVLHKENLVFDDKNLKYFYEPKPNQLWTWNAKWLDYPVNYSINSDSLNDRFDYPILKPIETYRIIILGDSFTFGAYINTPDNYAELLEDLLNNKLQCKKIEHFEIINLGVSAYDTEYIVNRFQKRGLKYNPDLVIWLANDGDFTKINEYILPVEEKLRNEGIPHEIEDGRKNIISKDQEIALKELRTKYNLDYIINYQKLALYKLANIYKGELIVFYFPSTGEKVKKLLEEFVILNTNYHYQEMSFNYWSNKSFQLQDRHPNKQGHKKIAEDIFEYLHKNMLSSCNVQDK